MFLSLEQQGLGLRPQKSKQTLNTLVGHHQVFLHSHFRQALTGKFRPEILVWRISASFQYNCAKNGKGLKIGTKEVDTT